MKCSCQAAKRLRRSRNAVAVPSDGHARSRNAFAGWRNGHAKPRNTFAALRNAPVVSRKPQNTSDQPKNPSWHTAGLVGQAFEPPVLATFQSPVLEHGTGKSREPAGWKACATSVGTDACTPTSVFWVPPNPEAHLQNRMPERSTIRWSGSHYGLSWRSAAATAPGMACQVRRPNRKRRRASPLPHAKRAVAPAVCGTADAISVISNMQ